MEWLLAAALRIIAAVALVYFGLGLFNVTWLMRVRAIGALAVGALLIGGFAWPFVRPELPGSAVLLVGSGITIPGALLCLLLAFIAGFAAWFVAWPAGKIFAPYAAPTGLAIWAIRSGTMNQLLLDYHEAAQRHVLYAALRWESFFWLLICATGYLGVLTASKLAGAKIYIIGQDDLDKPTGKNMAVNVLLAAAVTLIVTWFAVAIFAQDIHQADPKLGSVVGQPGSRQIAVGVFAAFALAAYIAKYGLKIGYLPVAAASSLLTFFGATQLLRGDTLAHLAANWPVAYFNHAINAITPLQMVAYGWLGAITGYWMAVKFHHKTWQSH